MTVAEHPSDLRHEGSGIARHHSQVPSDRMKIHHTLRIVRWCTIEMLQTLGTVRGSALSQGPRLLETNERFSSTNACVGNCGKVVN